MATFSGTEIRESPPKRWIAQQLSINGEGADWVLDPKVFIRKANLTFTSKFFWLLVFHRLYPIAADNILTWDRAILVAALVSGLKINFSKLLISVIYERALKTSTTYPFTCLIFQLCKDVGVPIWHCDVLRTLTGTVDIGLIMDEANVALPHRGTRDEL